MEENISAAKKGEREEEIKMLTRGHSDQMSPCHLPNTTQNQRGEVTTPDVLFFGGARLIELEEVNASFYLNLCLINFN